MGVVYRCSRGQAFVDGLLVDITWTARMAGFSFPFAVSAAVWEQCVCDPAEIGGFELESKKLPNALGKALLDDADRNPVHFEIDVPTCSGEQKRMSLAAVLGSGDHGEPVITVMFATELFALSV